MTASKKPTGYVIYEGPSLLDGSPIVAIALTGSSNRKTGNMVQTYILRTDMKPSDAVKTGQDVAICGTCKHRPSTGGSCYVVVCQGPTVVYKGYKLGKYPQSVDIRSIGANRMVRLGTYGDPAAIPAAIWDELVAESTGRTGYSHQWNNVNLDERHLTAISRLTMASVDSLAEQTIAKAKGLRYFRIRLANEPLQAKEFICPASDEANKVKSCLTCGACNGSEKATGANPVIIVHGNKASKFIVQRSLVTSI